MALSAAGKKGGIVALRSRADVLLLLLEKRSGLLSGEMSNESSPAPPGERNRELLIEF